MCGSPFPWSPPGLAAAVTGRADDVVGERRHRAAEAAVAQRSGAERRRVGEARRGRGRPVTTARRREDGVHRGHATAASQGRRRSSVARRPPSAGAFHGAALVPRRPGHPGDRRRRRLLLRRHRHRADEDPHRRALRQGLQLEANGAVVTGTATLPRRRGTTHAAPPGRRLAPVEPPVVQTRATIDNDIAVLTLVDPVKATPIRMTTSGDTASYKAAHQRQGLRLGAHQLHQPGHLPDAEDGHAADPVRRHVHGRYGSDFVKGHMVCAGKPATGSDAGTTARLQRRLRRPARRRRQDRRRRLLGCRGLRREGRVQRLLQGQLVRRRRLPAGRGRQPQLATTRPTCGCATPPPRPATRRTPRAPRFGAEQSRGNWDGVNIVLQTDLNRDGYQDLVVRDSASRRRLLDATTCPIRRRPGPRQQIFTNWKTRTRIITPGDVTGDYLPDMLSVDSAGALWVYPGKGNGTFGRPCQGLHRLEPVQLDRRPRRLQRRRQGRPDRPQQDRLGTATCTRATAGPARGPSRPASRCAPGTRLQHPRSPPVT